MPTSHSSLDATFAALSDPTRRGILARLERKQRLAVSELAKPLAMSLPAVMKHLDVLDRAGLIAREKTGRTVHCRLKAKPLREAKEWLERYEVFWQDRLAALADYLEKEKEPWTPKS
jgi:DNA-binding transcriptional ArsR family regulator